MNIKKHVIYGSIVFIWIVAPALEFLFSGVATDIVDGRCKRFPSYMSRVSLTIIGISNWILSYTLPLVVMVFCYARVVYTLRTKVTIISWWRSIVVRTSVYDRRTFSVLRHDVQSTQPFILLGSTNE